MIVESYHTAHEDTKGHTDGSVTFRTDDLGVKSSKQKINYSSSSKTEVIRNS